MAINTKHEQSLDTVIGDGISETEMDRRLEAEHDAIVGKLDEAYAEYDRGEAKPLEPLHVFLQRGRERQKAGKKTA